MCGIAGYSFSPDSSVERTLAVQALLAGIAERGADAVGYAWRGDRETIDVTKLRGGASAILDEIALPRSAHQALIHVRDFTKGHPDIEANNHPIRHGTVVGIHNGVIENDESCSQHGIDREEPE
jgi:glucosamine 6-phosphate synthetase-like amidotransferase/phosphosugar isomerase protein